MKNTRTVQELENRRRLAVQRVLAGYTQIEVAAFLGVDPRSVRRWMAAYHQGGMDALKAKPRRGRPPKLSRVQTRTVLRWFRKSPTMFGFRTELWTAPRVAQLIRQRMGVRMHPRYLNAWLTNHDITPQKPQKQARERDNDRIQSWINNDWPRILKKGRPNEHMSF